MMISTETGQCSSYAVPLSSNLESDSLMNPMEIAFMEVELHGAVSLYRFTSDRRT